MPAIEPESEAGNDAGKIPAQKRDVSSFDRLKRWLPLLFIAALTVIGLALGWHEHLSLSNLIARREDLGAFVADNVIAALLAYGGLYIAIVALSIPVASFLTIIGGFLFGWAICGPVTVIAASIGASIIFLAAQTSIGHALRDKAGPFISKLADGFRRDAFHYLLFLRLTPIFPFWVVNLAPAILHVPLRTFFIATALGIIPGTFAYAIVGAGLDSVIAAQEQANPGCAAAGTCSIDAKALITPELVAAFIALGIVSLMPVALKAWRRRKGAA